MEELSNVHYVSEGDYKGLHIYKRMRDEDTFETENKWYKANRDTISQICCIDPKYEKELKLFRIAYFNNEDKYQEISEATGVPAEVIAAIHYHESHNDFNLETGEIEFSVYLHNGQPLGVPTTDEPSDISFGENEFKEAAIDALEGRYDVEVKDTKEEFKSQNQLAYNVTQIKEGNTTMAALCTFAEYYNGGGYDAGKSSYLFNGAINANGENIPDEGLYTSDHNKNKDAVSEQPGIYLLLNSILEEE